MVLHDVSDDATGVEVAPSPFGPYRLLERQLHCLDRLVVPDWTEHLVPEPTKEQRPLWLAVYILKDALCGIYGMTLRQRRSSTMLGAE